MVRSIHKTKIAVFAFAVAGTIAITTNIKIPNINAAHDDSKDVTFNVNIAEALTVAIQEPVSWASGNTDGTTLLTNEIGVTAYSNTTGGASVKMYTTDQRLALADSSAYIDSIGTDYSKSGFPVNRWGWSRDDATYSAIPTTQYPADLFATTKEGDIGTATLYFGAKANNQQKGGTYKQNVYFVAVSRVSTTDPTPSIPPTNPATDAPTQNTATYNSTSNTTSYTYRTSATQSEGQTTTTIASPGNTENYQYVRPQGVTATTAGEGDGSTLATTLAVVAAVAATSGIFFFVLAKRRKDDEEDEDQA